METQTSANQGPYEELLRAIHIAGSQNNLANAINNGIDELGLTVNKVSQATVTKWKTRDKRIGPKYAAICEYALNGQVIRSKLRPDFLWPEHQGQNHHSPQREANDAGTVGSGHRNEALATGDLQPNKTSRGTPPESQGQPSVSGMRRRRRLPSSTFSSPCGGGSSTPNDAGVKP